MDGVNEELGLKKLAQKQCEKLIRSMQATAKIRKDQYVDEHLLEAKNGKRKKTLQILTNDLIQDLQTIPDYTQLASKVVDAESENLALTFA